MCIAVSLRMCITYGVHYLKQAFHLTHTAYRSILAKHRETDLCQNTGVDQQECVPAGSKG